MTIQFRTPPNYREPLITGGNTSAAYYRFFQGVDQGVPPAAEYVVTPTGSPFTFKATHGGFMIVSGGTVSVITFIRSLTTVTGLTSGAIPMSFGDQIIITYSVAPTLLYVPQ